MGGLVGLLAAVETASAQPAASDTLRLNLKQCLDMALRQNLDIQESVLELDQAFVDKFEADMAGWLPVFEVRSYASVVKDARGYITDTVNMTSWDNFGPYFEIKVQAVQPLTTFGRVTALRRAARLGIEAREAGIDVRRAQVAGEVYRYYYGILLAREMLDILRDASDKINLARDKVRTMLDEGSDKVTTVDLVKIDVYSFELERKRIEAEKGIRLAFAALRWAIGVPHDTPIEVADGRLRPVPEGIPSLDTLEQYAFANRPELAQVHAGAEARHQQVIAAEAERWPTPFVGAEFNYRVAPGRELLTDNPFVGDGYNGLGFKAAFGFQYSLDLSSREARIRRARVAYREMLRKQEWARASIALEVEKAYLESDEAERNSALGRLSRNQGRRWLIQTVERYDIGVASTRDLLEAYAAYLKSQSDYYQTLYSHYLAMAELYRTIGRPILDSGMVIGPSIGD